MVNVTILALSLSMSWSSLDYRAENYWRHELYRLQEEVREELEHIKYVEYMQKNFVSAHGEYIEEYVLPEPIQLDTEDISVPSNLTADEINHILSGTGMEGVGESVLENEETYNVNALVLCAIIAQETSWGTSRRAVEDNNLAGLGVYDIDSEGFRFMSKGDSIKYLAELIGFNYIQPGGKFYVGGKSVRLVSATYTPPCKDEWEANVVSISSKLYKKAVLYRERS